MRMLLVVLLLVLGPEGAAPPAGAT